MTDNQRMIFAIFAVVALFFGFAWLIAGPCTDDLTVTNGLRQFFRMCTSCR